MPMDLQTVLSLAAPLALSGTVWAVKQIHDSDKHVSVLRSELASLKDEVRRNHNEYREDAQEMKSTLNDVFKMMGGRRDRPEAETR